MLYSIFSLYINSRLEDNSLRLLGDAKKTSHTAPRHTALHLRTLSREGGVGWKKTENERLINEVVLLSTCMCVYYIILYYIILYFIHSLVFSP
jgi:hypothetical protein